MTTSAADARTRFVDRFDKYFSECHAARRVAKPRRMADSDFEWDPTKDGSNLGKHGIAFQHALALFLDPRHVVYEVTRPGEGERRWKAVGRVDETFLTIVYTWRGEKRRIISGRRSNGGEEKRYGNRPLSS